MIKSLFTVLCLATLATHTSCTQHSRSEATTDTKADKTVSDRPSTGILTGADQLSAYLPLLKNKKVGLMGNQTSIVGADQRHLVDVLLDNDGYGKLAFAREHGFRWNFERCEKVIN